MAGESSDTRESGRGENRGGARHVPASVLVLESGGCGACLQSVQALHATRYAARLRAAGIAFVTSPRHANVVLVTGAVSASARDPLQRMLDAVPRPHAVVAVGNCAIDGCVFGGSAALAACPADVLAAHVEIAGCPPAPTRVLAAIATAKRLLPSAASGDGDEHDDFDQ